MQSGSRLCDLHENMQRPPGKLAGLSHRESPATAGDSPSVAAERASSGWPSEK
jgi:hypothetical protein